jgi:hypothetical protein
MTTTLNHPSLSAISSARSAADPFQEEFIKFFWKGVGPTISANLDISRTDILIEAGILNTAVDSHRILDLCSGWPLLLQNLIKQLSSDPQRRENYHYVACDMNISSDDQHWAELVSTAKKHGIKLSLVSTNVSESDALRGTLRVKAKSKFDLILFSNALHEISPAKIPQLLFTLVDLLSDQGQLVLIDPKSTWLLDPERWSNLERLNQLEVDWEANAVWLPEETYRSILRLFGCTVRSFVPERSQWFYVLHAHRKNFNASERIQLVKEATDILRQALHTQIESENKRYISCRGELTHQLINSLNHNKNQLLYKAVEFCSVCASQAKRVEASEQLAGHTNS